MRSVKYIFLFALILAASAIFSAPANAQSPPSNPTDYCSQNNAGSGATQACSNSVGGAGHGCPPNNSLVYVIATGYTVAAPITVSDGTNAYSVDRRSTNGGSNYDIGIFSHYYATGSCVTVTATFGSGASLENLLVAWSTGTASSSYVDTTDLVTTSTNANPQVSNNFTTTNANDIIIASVVCAIASNTWSAGSGYTQPTSNWQGLSNAWRAEYKTVTSTGTYTSSFGNSSTCSTGVSIISLVTVAYKNGSPTSHARSHSSIINFRPHGRKIPWDDRRRKLQIVTI